jgi:hypothetical protein
VAIGLMQLHANLHAKKKDHVFSATDLVLLSFSSVLVLEVIPKHYDVR